MILNWVSRNKVGQLEGGPVVKLVYLVRSVVIAKEILII